MFIPFMKHTQPERTKRGKITCKQIFFFKLLSFFKYPSSRTPIHTFSFPFALHQQHLFLHVNQFNSLFILSSPFLLLFFVSCLFPCVRVINSVCPYLFSLSHFFPFCLLQNMSHVSIFSLSNKTQNDLKSNNNNNKKHYMQGIWCCKNNEKEWRKMNQIRFFCAFDVLQCVIFTRLVSSSQYQCMCMCVTRVKVI